MVRQHLRAAAALLVRAGRGQWAQLSRERERERRGAAVWGVLVLQFPTGIAAT